MKELDLDTIRKEVVHTGVLEAMIVLREARKKIESLVKDRELSTWATRSELLVRMSEDIISYENELSDIIGILIPERVEEMLNKS